MSKKFHRTPDHSIEVAGATVKDAIQAALQLLKAGRDDVEIQILCEEDKGLFGMKGARLAKIRATRKSVESRPLGSSFDKLRTRHERGVAESRNSPRTRKT